MPPKLYPRLMLALLTGLNILNYIDRNVLFAVQSDIKKEFAATDTQIGFLTSAFFFTYMFAAPLVGWMGDRYPRKNILVFGIFIWSGFTLLTLFVHDYAQLLLRHSIVGIGEASYATIAPTLIADSFSAEKRGNMLSIFYVGVPVGSAAGRMDRRPPAETLLRRVLHLSWNRHADRSPFHGAGHLRHRIAAVPGHLHGGLFPSDRHRSHQCGAGELRQSGNSVLGAGRQRVCHSSAGRRLFTLADRQNFG